MGDLVYEKTGLDYLNIKQENISNLCLSNIKITDNTVLITLMRVLSHHACHTSQKSSSAIITIDLLRGGFHHLRVVFRKIFFKTKYKINSGMQKLHGL